MPKVLFSPLVLFLVTLLPRLALAAPEGEVVAPDDAPPPVPVRIAPRVDPDEAPPPPYARFTAAEERRDEEARLRRSRLLYGGVGLFLGSYLPAFAAGLGLIGYGVFMYGGLSLLPVFGPWVLGGMTAGAPGIGVPIFIDAIAQTVGLALLIAGSSTHAKNEHRFALAPMFDGKTAGLGATWRF